jgi:hypothetical protein
LLYSDVHGQFHANKQTAYFLNNLQGGYYSMLVNKIDLMIKMLLSVMVFAVILAESNLAPMMYFALSLVGVYLTMKIIVSGDTETPAKPEGDAALAAS